jgi:hypothetical protein
MRAELEDDELEEELLELDDELLEFEDELLELEDELEDELLLEPDDEDELDWDELEESLGPAGLSSPQPCSSMPRPASATLPERIRRNWRRSSRRSVGSGPDGFLNIGQTSTPMFEQSACRAAHPAQSGGSAPPS